MQPTEIAQEYRARQRQLVAAAVRRSGGEAARIRWQPDSQIQQIISGWPRVLQAPPAEALGSAADTGMDEAGPSLY
jgi:hypothetical protein